MVNSPAKLGLICAMCWRLLVDDVISDWPNRPQRTNEKKLGEPIRASIIAATTNDSGHLMRCSAKPAERQSAVPILLERFCAQLCFIHVWLINTSLWPLFVALLIKRHVSNYPWVHVGVNIFVCHVIYAIYWHFSWWKCKYVKQVKWTILTYK